MKGKVYLFRQKKTDFYKIGYSCSSVESRLRTMNMYSPYGAEMISVIESEDAPRLERRIHKHFKDRRVNGEFFILTPEDVNKFKTYQSEKLNEFINECILIYEQSNDPEMLLKKFKSTMMKSKSNEELNYLLPSIREKFKGKFVKTVDIHEFVNNNFKEKISPRSLGLLMANNFESDSKAIEGIRCRGYYI